MKKPLPLRVQIYRREEQRPQDPGAKRLRLRPGGGPEGLRSRAPQIREICADPEELRGLQGGRERKDISDEGPGCCRGGGGLGRKNSRRRDCLLIKLLLYPSVSEWPA